MTVVSAEVRKDGRGNARVRISSPAGWLSGDELEPAEPVPSLWLDFDTFQKCHLEMAAGDHYGLEFPFTIDLLQEFGTEFLTAAFRASGAISQNNHVTEMAVEPVTVMGSSERVFLTLAYAFPEPGLQTELFAKFPPQGAEYKSTLSAMAHGEVAMQRFSRSSELPVTLPKYYFGDYCSKTTNYILITERVQFGVPPNEPAYRKGYDQEIPEIDDHYRVLTEALARLCAAHKTGILGYQVENIFPFARAARIFASIDDCEAKVERLVDFVGRVAPQLFPAEATRPEFLRRWQDDLVFGLVHKDVVISYLHQNVDYTGLCHPNLNPDNAWYWRDTSGRLQAGLIDWNGAGQMSIAQALSGMLMMPDPDRYLQLQRDVIATFTREYAAEGGLMLDPNLLAFQYKASVFSTAICTIVDIVVPFLSSFTDEDYRRMNDRFDCRLAESGLVAAIIWINNMLSDWLDDVTPGDACRAIVAECSAGHSAHQIG